MLHLADCSLSLINQTGAHFVAREITGGIPHRFSAIRYWRAFLNTPPQGYLRKALARLMMAEIVHGKTSMLLRWPEPSLPVAGRLFMDPLYVMRSRLDERDIVISHDIGPISHPDLFDPSVTALYESAYRKIKEAKPGLVFVSAASRDAFVSQFGDDFRFLKVIPLFVRRQSVEGPIQAPPGVKKPYLLTVGAFERRKNLPLAIQAFQKSGLADRGVSYILCGAHGLDGAAVLSAAESTPGVKPLPYVSEAELRWLYQNAEGFVLPSLLEGFGMPALEAAHCGLPAIISDGALSEAVGNLGMVVDPLSIDEVADAMRRLIDMPPEERAERAALLKEHAKSCVAGTISERMGHLAGGRSTGVQAVVTLRPGLA